MKYAVEMGSCAVIYIPSFIKIGSGIQKLIRRIHRHIDTQTAWRSHKSTFIF
jgi:Uri superfamily endonuclease